MTGKAFPPYHIRFLGTAGSRFSVFRQLRASGGIWISLDKEHWIVDPGPGSLVQIHQRVRHARPEDLEGVLLTHRHIDHSSDLNILTEAITGGGFSTKGHLLLPEDAVFNPEPVLFGYLRDKVEKITFWKEGCSFPLGNEGSVEGIRLIHHGVDCFGFRAYHPHIGSWGLISDTSFFPELCSFFKTCRLLIINVTLKESRSHLDHLSIEEAHQIVAKVRPELALITHMGTQILEKGPTELISRETLHSSTTFPAQDGMMVDLQEQRIVRSANF
jgi:phosphoribosyl 1,2-cyclic phosphodiesterase